MTFPWIPSSLEELEASLKEGLFGEMHYRDAKRELVPGPVANKELAKDLASFAIDGGALFIGIAEPSPGTFVLEPLPLDGLAERVEQVARSRVSPPLTTRSLSLLTESRDAGILVVVVPPSPVAPHMVDHRYWGRGDKTKYALDDAEVLRLHERRKQWERSAEELLEREVARSPFGPNTDKPQYFIVVDPVGAQPEALVPIIADENWVQRLADLVRLWSQVPRIAQQISPTFADATTIRKRPNGWALSSNDITADRRIAPDAYEPGLIDLELHENGGLRLFCARLIAPESTERPMVVFDKAVLGHLIHLLAIAKTIAEACGFYGSWDVGCAMNNMRGAMSAQFANIWIPRRFPVYSEELYCATTRFTYEELEAPASIVRRVLGRFLRALGTHNDSEYAPYLGNQGA